MQNLAEIQRRIFGRQKDEAGGNLAGLAKTAELAL